MELKRLKPFRDAMKEAAEAVMSDPGREITVVHHNDTDGIASGAILRRALTRAGFAVENLPIERVHPAFLPAIHTQMRRIILYADLGGQAAEAIAGHIRKGSRVIILDHHMPGAGKTPGLLQVNPELFGIDGDRECAAASAVCFFSLALDRANEDLAVLAVLGAEGDHQMTDGRGEGLNALLLETALQRGDLRPAEIPNGGGWRFPRLEDRSLREANEWIISLAVNGYYRRGAELALDLCLNGPDNRIRAFAEEMAGIRENRFGEELNRIGRTGVARTGDISWVDVESRFFPLGLKAIGLFCEELIRTEAVGEEDYVVGFQRFPEENPYLGRFPGRETKASFRVTTALRRRIESGEKPDLMALVPDAVRRVGGFAEACHRYSAACTIPEERKAELVGLLAAETAKSSALP